MSIIVVGRESKGRRSAPAETGRSRDGYEQMMASMVRYFMGVDPAPSQGKRSDDGAMAVLKAWPKVPEPRNLVGDWQTAFVWAERYRGKRIPEWSGELHRVHQNFNLSGICMDPGGGGQHVQMEMAVTRQLINGIDVECTPIVCPEIESGPMGDFILRMMKRGGLDELWPSSTMRGDDNLWHNGHVAFQEAIEHGCVWLPVPYNERSAEERNVIDTEWPVEKMWALKVLSAGILQLQDIQVETDEKGEFLTSRNGAFSFSSVGKKDIGYAMMMAWVDFVHWLKVAEEEFERGGGDGGGGGPVVF